MFLKKDLNKGDSYAVHTGAYAGEILIYIERNNDTLGFLSIPTMKNREIPLLVFENAKEKKIIKFVEKLPSLVAKVSAEQYKTNINTLDEVDNTITLE